MYHAGARERAVFPRVLSRSLDVCDFLNLIRSDDLCFVTAARLRPTNLRVPGGSCSRSSITVSRCKSKDLSFREHPNNVMHHFYERLSSVITDKIHYPLKIERGTAAFGVPCRGVSTHHPRRWFSKSGASKPMSLNVGRFYLARLRSAFRLLPISYGRALLPSARTPQRHTQILNERLHPSRCV